jgi:hypothetical protein
MGLLNNDSALDLDESVDSTVSAPDFVTPPSGKYILAVSGIKTGNRDVKNEETGEGEKQGFLRATLKVVSTAEVAEGQIPVADGSLFSQQWNWSEQGKGFFKKFAEDVLGVEACKGASWKQLIDELPQNHQFNARLTVKVTKGKEGKEYTNINLNNITPVA